MAGALKILGVIIAGGRSRRFCRSENLNNAENNHKFLADFGGQSLLSYIINRAQDQVETLILNINEPVSRIAAVAEYGLPVIGDHHQDGGPLAGLYTALCTATDQGNTHVLTFAGDCPFFPADYGTRLIAAAADNPACLAVASSAERCHPVMGLFPVTVKAVLKQYLDHGARRAGQWVAQQPHRIVTWPNSDPDPFFNINWPEELALARKML